MTKFNPYTDLKRRFSEFANACYSRGERGMWTYTKGKLSDSWRLDDLYQRVAAAEQIGYEVVLRATDQGLEVKYVKKLPIRPYDI